MTDRVPSDGGGKARERTGLFAGKIHFSLPSAESPFPFPSGEPPTADEDAAFLIEEQPPDA